MPRRSFGRVRVADLELFPVIPIKWSVTDPPRRGTANEEADRDCQST
jgi:hypothetical protein